MTDDPRPICPIPPDARVGDIVLLRDGSEYFIEAPFDGDNWPLKNHCPGFAHADGSAWCGHGGWEVVAFIYADNRKPNLPHTGKPKRTQLPEIPQ